MEWMKVTLEQILKEKISTDVMLIQIKIKNLKSLQLKSFLFI